MSKSFARKNISLKLGAALILIGSLIYLSLLVVPFLSFSAEAKVGAVAGGLIVGEVFFWLGAILVGKEVIAKYKNRMRPKNWKNVSSKQKNS